MGQVLEIKLMMVMMMNTCGDMYLQCVIPTAKAAAVHKALINAMQPARQTIAYHHTIATVRLAIYMVT